MRRHVHQAVLVHADVDERAERGHVGDHALQQHAGLEVGQIFSTPSAKVAVLKAGRGSRPGFSSSLEDVGDGRADRTSSSTNSVGFSPRQALPLPISAGMSAAVAPGSAGPPGTPRVHAGRVERVVAAGDAQEAGALLERLRAEPRHLLERRAGAERPVGVAVRHDARGEALADAGDPGEQRRGRGVDVDAHAR